MTRTPSQDATNEAEREENVATRLLREGDTAGAKAAQERSNAAWKRAQRLSKD